MGKYVPIKDPKSKDTFGISYSDTQLNLFGWDYPPKSVNVVRTFLLELLDKLPLTDLTTTRTKVELRLSFGLTKVRNPHNYLYLTPDNKNKTIDLIIEWMDYLEK